MKKAAFLILIGVVLFLAISVLVLLRGVQQATQPVIELQQGVATEVARLLHPTPTIIPDPVTIVHEVQSLARLETIHYSVEKVITAETRQGPFGFLFGDRLLLVAHGSVIAGVDLAGITESDISIDENGMVTLQLPAAEVFIATLDNEKTYVYDREVGFLRRGDVELETAARLAAEEAILEAALTDGILEQAQVNADGYLFRLLRSLGFSDVRFTSASQ
ncbi:MAG: DUF4230 domain-containing protein [Anaerolineales bacterium]|nr:DUF4230 domain-containing protein [Anaerolineales bacterium]MCK5634107.1 DUF4230 domain-containing protein [Anaerolineales bacterium]